MEGLIGDLVTIDHGLAFHDTSNWKASSTAHSTAILAAPATNRRLPRGVASLRLQVQCRLRIDIAAGNGISAARTGVAFVRARGRRGPARDWRGTKTCKTVIRATITETKLTAYYEIDHRHTTAQYPQSNEATKRPHRFLKTYLKSYLTNKERLSQ